MRQYGLPHGWPYHPPTICGPDTPSPAITRWPPASASTVPAAIAAAAGVRAASCMMPVPRRMRFVSAARYASGVIASDPYASAVHTESKPSFSARRILSTGSFSSAPEYPMLSPSFIAFLLADSCGEPLRRARPRFRGDVVAVLRRRHRLERVQQVPRDGRDVVDSREEPRFVGLRGLRETADLPHELQGRRANLLAGDRRLEVEQGPDVPAHDRYSISTPPSTLEL